MIGIEYGIFTREAPELNVMERSTISLMDLKNDTPILRSRTRSSKPFT